MVHGAWTEYTCRRNSAPQDTRVEPETGVRARKGIRLCFGANIGDHLEQNVLGDNLSEAAHDERNELDYDQNMSGYIHR